MKVFILYLLTLFILQTQASTWPTRVLQNEELKHKVNLKPIVVAVIDTGLDIRNPLFKNRLWKNINEIGVDKNGIDKCKNKIDDDNNGFIDDCNGWNFVSNSKIVNDKNGHGTHVSSLIIENSSNSIIMPLKYYSKESTPEEQINNTVRAVEYAIKMGVNIINYSAGGYNQSQKEFHAILKAKNHNILFVTAAGNQGINTDHSPFYPAKYKLENILSVAAINKDVKLLKSSNYGKDINIAAPGDEILATSIDSKEVSMTGTSQATAFATATAATILGRYPKLPPQEIIKNIQVGSKKIIQGQPPVLNALRSFYIKSRKMASYTQEDQGERILLRNFNSYRKERESQLRSIVKQLLNDQENRSKGK